MTTPLRRYYRGYDLAAIRDAPAATTRYVHLDGQGTVQCLTDSTGAVTDRFASDAWGNQVKRTGTSINRQWYVGNWGYYRQVDRALDSSRLRCEGPSIGRWLSRCIFGVSLPFPYVLGRPSELVDPQGMARAFASVTSGASTNATGSRGGLSYLPAFRLRVHETETMSQELEMGLEMGSAPRTPWDTQAYHQTLTRHCGLRFSASPQTPFYIGGPCGYAQWGVYWHIPRGCTGFVLQHLKWVCSEKSCPSGKSIPCPDQVKPSEFWEAFRVVDGRIVYPPECAQHPGYDDLFGVPNQGLACFGKQQLIGYARFVLGQRLPPPWHRAPQGHPAHCLFVRDDAPPGWSDTGTIRRELWTKWWCCPPKPKKTIGDVEWASV
jgi:hypothetical protein